MPPIPRRLHTTRIEVQYQQLLAEAAAAAAGQQNNVLITEQQARPVVRRRRVRVDVPLRDKLLKMNKLFKDMRMTKTVLARTQPSDIIL